MATSATLQMVISLKDHALAGLKKLDGLIAGIEEKVLNLSSALAGASDFLGLKTLADEAVETAANFELLEKKAVETAGKSAAAGAGAAESQAKILKETVLPGLDSIQAMLANRMELNINAKGAIKQMEVFKTALLNQTEQTAIDLVDQLIALKNQAVETASKSAAAGAEAAESQARLLKEKVLPELESIQAIMAEKMELQIAAQGAITQIEAVKTALEKLPPRKVIEIVTKTSNTGTTDESVEDLGMADGGRVPGWSSHSRADNISARLTAGEWVIQRPSVIHYGHALMNAINRRLIDKRSLLAAAAGSLKTKAAEALPPAIAAVGGSLSPISSSPGYALGGAVVNAGNAIPDWAYLRFLNDLYQYEILNEKTAAKMADAAKMQAQVAERWGGLLGDMNSAGFGAGGLGLGGGGTININLDGSRLSDTEFKSQLTRVLKNFQMRRSGI